MKSFYEHIKQWAEVYFWLPLLALAVPGSALAIYYLTGSAPQESLDWLLALAGRALTIIVALVLVSAIVEATGTWMTKQEKFDNRYVYTITTLSKLVLFVVVLYALTH